MVTIILIPITIMKIIVLVHNNNDNNNNEGNNDYNNSYNKYNMMITLIMIMSK